jgi:hypothetical protein
MLQEAIYKFKASGPMLLPDLIDNYWIGETMEKPLNFAPFGHAELSLLAKI